MAGKNSKKKKKTSQKKSSNKPSLDENNSQLASDEASSDKPNTSQKTKFKFSVEDLMERVNDYVENFEFELAVKFCEKAEKLEPENVKVLETFGNLYAELGDIESARQYYMRAVKLEPDGRHVKYLCLAQLSDGLEALQYYQKAIELIKKNSTTDAHMADDEHEYPEGALSLKDLSTVYCSIAEIYMTDLCMEENAEEECKKCCQLAIDYDKDNMEGYISMCNCLLSVGDVENATANCKKAFEVWHRLSDLAQDSIRDVIPYPSRLSLVKLLIEVEEYSSVSPIIEQLIEENEDDLLIWYYMGLSKSLQRQNDTKNSKSESKGDTEGASCSMLLEGSSSENPECSPVSNSKQSSIEDSPRYFLERAKVVYAKTGCEELEILEHIEELLEECHGEPSVLEPENDSLQTIEENEEGMEMD